MPIYEYQCQACHKRFELSISYDEYDKKKVTCAHCKSDKVSRRIGRIRVLQSEENRLESWSDPATLDGLEDDPRALGRMMRQMGSELGEELGPEFDEVVDRLEAGQSPEEIEESLPDIGGGNGDFDLP